MKNFESIASARPDLAKQWDCTANFPLTPDMVMLHSHKQYSWRCDKGHTWKQSPDKRARSTSAECPYCTGKRILPGDNDMLTLHPELEIQWDYEMNTDLDPHTLAPHSNLKVNWVCRKGHRWKTGINHRTDQKNPTQCPYCANQKVAAGENDLLTVHPDVAQEWDYEANTPLTPSDVFAGSSKRVNWICAKNPNHKWITSVAHRTGKEATGCPYCNGHKILPGENDMATLFPTLLSEWDFEANGDVDPHTIGPYSNKLVHWKCSKGHRWICTVNKRTRDNSGCPYDSGRRAIPGESDLATLHPSIARQWHPDKNIGIEPTEVRPGSNKKVWWKCDLGHEWQAKICNRTYLGNNCPVCNGRKPDVGKSDLCSRAPLVAKDWDFSGNNGTTPQDYCAESTFIADWKCHLCGTKWKKSIFARFRGNKCPTCGGRKLGD